MDKNILNTVRWFRRYFSLTTILVVGAFVYVIFFSETSAVNKIEYQRIIDSLNAELKVSSDSMIYYKNLNSRLTTDPSLMEKVVREQHNMKRTGEDVFIFTRE